MRAILPGSFGRHFPSLLLLHECTVYALPTNQGEVKRDPRAAQWPFAALLLQHPRTMEAPAVDTAAVVPLHCLLSHVTMQLVCHQRVTHSSEWGCWSTENNLLLGC